MPRTGLPLGTGLLGVGDGAYYWVPGTWVMPPTVGYLWTPGYWGWVDGAYVWHAGYWGPHVGFYGGINYGFGYTGVGFAGGYWRGGVFFYNRAVANVASLHVTNVYNRTVINNVSVTRVSYNGGAGGVRAVPTPMELAAAHERHIAFTPMQRQHVQLAAHDPAFRASVNGGRPALAATARPAQFAGRALEAPRPGGAPQFRGEGAERIHGQSERFDRPSAWREPGPRGGGPHAGAPHPMDRARPMDRPHPMEHGREQERHR